MAAPVHLAIFLALFLPHLGMGQEPYLELLPNKILKPVGEGVYVSCSAIVPDPDLVTEMTWRDPNGEKIPNQDRSVNILDEGRPGKLDLVISKLRDQDVGEYECVATYAGNQRLSAKVMVESFMDIDFGDTPNHQTPFIYTEAKIQCTPQARPAPRVDWLKDMVALKNDDRHIIQQDGILIKNVTLEDEGTYRCRARVPQLGSIKFRDIQVEVYIPPRITHPPQDLKGVEKESVTFTCEAEGKPAPSYSWVDKDNRPLEDLEGYFVDRETGVLTILSLKPEDTGNYRCSASNQAGDDERTAHLQVLTKPKVEQYLNLTTQVEAEGEMRCVVTGQPDPTVVFKKETNEADFVPGINQDDRISVHQETDDQGRQVGILKIRQVSRSDDGLYTCTAKSEGGVTQVWGHITVEFKPTFEEQAYEEMWSWEQRPVNLTCLATSIPNATIEWYLRNQEIDPNDPNLRVMALGPLGVMQVTPLSALYFGDYTCQATNTLGVTSFDIELKEAHVPGPVADATVDKKTATTITWIITDPADDGGLPIQGYVVEYRLRDTKWEEGESKFWTKGSSYTLDGLTPMMTYIFRFAARSEAGLGEWGGEESVDMPKHAAPEEPLIFNVKPGVTEIPYPDRYTLQWSVPLDNGKEIDYFQVMYYQVQNVSGKWETQGSPTTETIEFPGKSTYTVENLHSNAHYKIELRAHNEIGFSTPAEVIIKTANGPGVSESVDGGVGVGVIIAIIIVLAIIVIVIADVTCYCTRNAGLTAKIIGKKDPKDKDKEAMLDEGKNASADTLTEEPRDDEKTISEKPPQEKEEEKKPEKLEIKSEIEPEDKHEGNGQMKTPEDPKMNQQDDNDKNKEPAEPTETTPMIQGEKDDKEAILKEEQQKEGDTLKKSGSKGSITKDSPV